jgi:thioredoxin reductase (NADPH)
MLDRAKANEKIRWQLDSEVLEVLGDGNVSGVRLRNTVNGEESVLDVTGVFMAIGHDPRSSLVKGQVDVDADGYVLVRPQTTYTNLDGVFAAGDLVDRTYRQAITAAGSGCAAAIDAERWLAEHGAENASSAPELVGGGYAPTQN